MRKRRSVFKKSVRRFASGTEPKRLKDTLVAEEPFTLVWSSQDGKSERLSSTMRTPGDDLALAAGLLFSEGLVLKRDELKEMSFCVGGGVNELNRLRASLQLSAEVIEGRLQRRPSNSLPQSACGLCSADKLPSPEVLLEWARSRYTGAPCSVPARALRRALSTLHEEGPLFQSTGASHACLVVDRFGEALSVAEDVGRHNAADKAIGHLLLSYPKPELPFSLPEGSGVFFSSRLSFELAAKAVAAGASWMASVGAPTHLAVELAQACGVPLYGFVSEERFNLYTDLPVETRVSPSFSAQIQDTLFDGFLKYHNYRVEVEVEAKREILRGGFVHGPGHHAAVVAGLAFDQSYRPHPILKSGDTRPTRSERGESYVLPGFIAGRLDKEGAEVSKIALEEIAEEVGGRVLGDTFRSLGQSPSPTMSWESSEADHYYLAAVEFHGEATGDGGGMEASELLGPALCSPDALEEFLKKGQVSEVGRTQVLFDRAFAKIGYLPVLGVYVQDHPKLQNRFSTLGLGEHFDIRSLLLRPEALPEVTPKSSKLNSCQTMARRDIPLAPGHTMVDAKFCHAISNGNSLQLVNPEFPCQYLQLNYDRVKLVEYRQNSRGTPYVRLEKNLRPALSFAPGELRVERWDVLDTKIDRDRALSEQLPEGSRSLACGGGASPGQSDLYYHYAARELEEDAPGELVPLDEAIRLCREDHGDVHTETVLLRLCQDLQWSPNLRMSWTRAAEFLS